MLKRNRRILWLLNHKTLMPFEVGLLLELGYEVFTPKVLPPAARFRSAAVDASYDASLSIPAFALRRLNAFDFYESEWPADIVALVNRYFATVFIIPFGKQVPEALTKFEGQILFRAFGLDNTQTYVKALESMYGASIFARIDAVGDRFWFAEGYEQLSECEPPIIARKELFLPIGVPDTFWATANQYNGTDRRILFICPHVVTNSYYAEVYKAFKRDFGDLPHVIVGAQDVETDDPHVAGFVSNEELARLFRECVVNYYHSTERRHVHYSPIEAAINGMPVVYYADSLLGRMTEEVTHGRCADVKQAREAVERILANDVAFIEDVRKDQLSLSYQFSGPYCREVWSRELARSGLLARLEPEAGWRVALREIRRIFLRPFAHGLSHVAPRALPPMPSYEALGMDEPDPVMLRTLDEGVDFREESYPWFVADVSNVSYAEPAGRWTIGPAVVIDFVEPLPRRFRLVVVGAGYERNIGADATILIDRQRQEVGVESYAGDPREMITEWKVGRRVRRIEILVPFPTTPPGDNRALGLALESLRIEALD